MYQVAKNYKIFTLASTGGTAKNLGQLLKTANGAVLPPTVLQLAITPNVASCTITDLVTTGTVTLTAGSRTVFPCRNIHNLLNLTSTDTVSIEVYFD